MMTDFAHPNRTLCFKLSLLGSAVAALFPAAALAQESGDGATLETNRTTVDGESLIIVTARNYVPQGSGTATKADIPLIETPQSVSVITRDQIDLLNFVDAQQAVRYVAGVTGENYGPDLRFDFIQVRGFTPKQFIDGLATPVTTSILSNGVDLYAFESFDILKGPASVLYGSAPPGGLYNQTSRRASSEFGGEVSVKYGEDDYKQAAMTVTGAASEFLDVRITALYRDRDAQRDFVHAKRIYAAPTATLHLGPATTLTGIGYYQYDEVNGDTNGFLPVQGTLLPNPNGRVKRSVNLGEPDYNRYERTQWAAGFEFKHEFGNGMGAAINTRWSDYDEDQKVIYGSSLAADNRTVYRSSFPYAETVKAFTIDGRLSADMATGDIKHALLAGVDYRNVRNNASFGFCGPIEFADPANPFSCLVGPRAIDLYNPVYGLGPAFVETPVNSAYTDLKLKQTGVYAQDQIALGDLKLLLSGRYDWVKLNSFGTPKKQDKFTWRAGLNYVTASGFAPYVSYATSFEPTLGVDTNGDAFKPTTGNQIEGGIKFDGRAFGDDVKLFATAAVFRIQQKNVASAVYGAVTTPPIGAAQTGEVEVNGGELEFVARIRDQLSINGSYAYTDSEVKDSDVVQEIGEPMPVTPKHKLSLFVDYTLQRGTLGGLGFGFGGRYTSGSYGALPGPFVAVTYKSDSATLFDAIIHYDTPGWRFAINGSNIFDKVYVARCAGDNNCTYGAGRQVIGTVTKKF